MQFECLTRKDLQSLAKSSGVKANQSSADIIRELKAVAHQQKSSVDDKPTEVTVEIASSIEASLDSFVKVGITVEIFRDSQWIKATVIKVNKKSVKVLVLSTGDALLIKSDKLRSCCLDDNRVTVPSEMIDNGLTMPSEMIDDNGVTLSSELIDDNGVTLPLEMIDGNRVTLPSELIDDNRVTLSSELIDELIDGNRVTLPSEMIDNGLTMPSELIDDNGVTLPSELSSVVDDRATIQHHSNVSSASKHATPDLTLDEILDIPESSSKIIRHRRKSFKRTSSFEAAVAYAKAETVAEMAIEVPQDATIEACPPVLTAVGNDGKTSNDDATVTTMGSSDESGMSRPDEVIQETGCGESVAEKVEVTEEISCTSGNMMPHASYSSGKEVLPRMNNAQRLRMEAMQKKLKSIERHSAVISSTPKAFGSLPSVALCGSAKTPGSANSRRLSSALPPSKDTTKVSLSSAGRQSTMGRVECSTGKRKAFDELSDKGTKSVPDFQRLHKKQFSGLKSISECVDKVRQRSSCSHFHNNVYVEAPPFVII